MTTPGLIPPKTNAQNRPAKSMGGPMITIATAQVLLNSYLVTVTPFQKAT